jgi:hypothetical protein
MRYAMLDDERDRNPLTRKERTLRKAGAIPEMVSLNDRVDDHGHRSRRLRSHPEPTPAAPAETGPLVGPSG